MKINPQVTKKLLFSILFLAVTGLLSAQNTSNRPTGNPAGQAGNNTTPAGQTGGNQTNQTNATNNTNTAVDGTAEAATEDQADVTNADGAVPAPVVKTTLERLYGYNLFSTVKLDVINTSLNNPTPNNYVLGPGDQLVIDITNVAGYSEQLQTVTVNRDGDITVPKAGLIHIGGSSIKQAERKLAASIGRFYGGATTTEGRGSTTINLSLSQPRSISIQILGEVNAPGTYTATSLTSMFNALYLAGGPNEIGSFRKVNLVRGNEVVSTLDLYDILTHGFSSNDMLLKDQDVIQVGPFVSRMAVEGNVKRTGLFELLPGQRLIDLVSYAGGFGPNAYSKQVKVYRNTSRERKIINITKMDYEAFEMVDGDSLVVEKVLERFENLVTIDGAVFRPGEYSLDSNPTLLSLIESAEGFQEDALMGRVTILRSNEFLELVNIPVNVRDIKLGLSQDIALQREDQIIVPSLFTLTEISSIRIQGALNNPDAASGIGIAYVKGITLKDVIVQAGGLTESASLNRIEIARRKRNVDPTAADATISDIFYFDVNPDLSFSKDMSEFELQPYDEIFVRTSPNYVPQTFVTVEGEVLFPANYALQSKDERISDLIKRTGGLTPLAFVEGATLVRRIQLSEAEIEMREKTLADIQNGAKDNEVVETEEIDPTKMETIGIDFRQILQKPGSVDDLILLDGDIIRIPKRLETVRVQGQVLYPTSVRFQQSKNFMDYISESGGFNKKAQRSLAYVLYPNGSVDRTRRFLFVNIFPDIEPGSEIIIPEKTVNTEQKIAQTNALVSTVTATVSSLLTLFTLLQLNRIN